MVIAMNSCILVLLAGGFVCLTDWLYEVGVQEIIIYTEGFLQEETNRVRIKVLPEVNSTKPWDRLELLLYYSGIRGLFPFVSAKVWLLVMTLVVGSSFLLGVLCLHTVWKAAILCMATGIGLMQVLQVLRRSNLRKTEGHLLELLNVTESFAVTGDEPIAILSFCAVYMKGPIGQALKSIDKRIQQGWSSGMVLAQLKVMLEHPKWQEFIHNLGVCSMYNSDFTYVFRSSRKSIQEYLSSKKERQGVKHTAQLEMAAIAILSFTILVVMSGFLQMSVGQLLWGSAVSKGCTIYMVGIVGLFFWKIGIYEKE